MSFPVRLGSFAKKTNSTLQPSANFGTEYNCIIKQGTDLLSPVLGFDFGLTQAPYSLNYAIIDAFHRYYFIKNWEFRDRLWWAYLKVDSLGTYKSAIGSSNCYITRATSKYNVLLPDTLYPVQPEPLVQKDVSSTKTWSASSFSNGTYIIGVLGQSGSAGAVSYYALSPAQMQAFRTELMSSTDSAVLTNLNDVSIEMAKALINPFQYLVSATWFPFSIPSGDSFNIKMGWWTFDTTGRAISALKYTKITQYSIAPHSVAKASGGGYRFASPYSKYIRFIPPFGEIELDAGILARAIMNSIPNYIASVTDTITVDLVTGNAYLQITCGNATLAYREGKVGVPAQLGQITQDISGALSTVLHGASNAARGGLIAGILDAGATAIDATIQIQPKVTTSGSNGTTVVFDLDTYTEMVYYPQIIENPNELGRPLCATDDIQELSGYIKTYKADIQIPYATLNELEEIKAYMDGGFFYE